MTDWNFADVYEVVAGKVPDAPCQKQGDRIVTWAEFDARANGLAADLLDAGLSQQSKVAAYLTNCPEYLEAWWGVLWAGGVFNPVNPAFTGREAAQILADSRASVVICRPEMAEE